MSAFDEKVAIRRYEDTVPDSKGTGVPRKMTREIWLEECFPEWHCMLNQQIEVGLQISRRGYLSG